MDEARRRRLAAVAAAEAAIVRHVLVMDATPGPYRTEGDRLSWYLELAGGRLVAPFPAAELGEHHEVTARQAGLRLVRDEGTALAACEACYRATAGEAPAPDPDAARRRADAARRALRWCSLDPEVWRRLAAAEAGLPGERLEAAPEAERESVAAEIRSYRFTGADGGTCLYRALAARRVLRRRLGLDVPLAFGGMIYRAGPHPVRDVVAYCGCDNRAATVAAALAATGLPAPAGEVGGLHHWWLEADGVVLDFSPPDWRDYGAGPEVAAHELALYGRTEGDVVWTHEPPAFVWHRRGEGTVLPTAPGEPPPGSAYYTAEPAIPADRRPAVAAAEAGLERALATAAPASETEVRLGGAAAA